MSDAHLVDVLLTDPRLERLIQAGVDAIVAQCFRQIAALIVRETTAHPGFRDMIDTIRWEDI